MYYRLAPFGDTGRKSFLFALCSTLTIMPKACPYLVQLERAGALEALLGVVGEEATQQAQCGR